MKIILKGKFIQFLYNLIRDKKNYYFFRLQEDQMLKKLLNLSKMQYKENQTRDFVKRKEQSINVVSD